jgi:hypothetical protein
MADISIDAVASTELPVAFSSSPVTERREEAIFRLLAAG